MNASHKLYAVSNLIVLILVISWNYLTNIIGINGNTVSSVSAEYENLFTPAGYAFSIWGIIYIGLLAQAIFMLRSAYNPAKDSHFISQIGPYLIMANVFNGIWLYAWLSEYTGISVFLITLILLSLIIVILNLNMERWDAPARIIFWIWWPICLYSGWIAVATIANVSAYLAKLGWSGPFSEETWAVIMILVAGAVNLFLIYARNMREFSLVGVWALVAIAVRHWGQIPVIQYTAVTVAAVLLVASGIHGYQNRHYFPFTRRI